MAKKKQKKAPPPTVITLTLPTPDADSTFQDETTATLLIQRGDLAQLRQFDYDGQMPGLILAVREASAALDLLEKNPPVIPAKTTTSKSKRKKKQNTQPAADEEPTIEVPLKKGTQAVKVSHLKIVSGDSDAAAYKQAAVIAGRLIDGKLWDGESPIRIENVYDVAKKMQHLTGADFSLFTLGDFVQTGDPTPGTDTQSDNEGEATENAEAQKTLV